MTVMEADMDALAGFDEFVARQWPRLVRAAVLLGNSPHDAEDLAQTVLVRCMNKWDAVSTARHVDSYVGQILRNEMATSRRRRWWAESPTDHVPETTAVSGIPDDHGPDVIAALKRLPEKLRLAVVYRYWLDLTEEQTAFALGVPIGTVKSRTSRGSKALACDPTMIEIEKELR